jgi:hypothetical protein
MIVGVAAAVGKTKRDPKQVVRSAKAHYAYKTVKSSLCAHQIGECDNLQLLCLECKVLNERDDNFFGGEGGLLFIIFVGLGTKCKALIFFCPLVFLTQSMLLVQLSFSQIYHLSSRSLQKWWKYLLQPLTKYICTNEKRQNCSYATKRFIFLYHSKGTWITVSCTVHSLHSMLAKMIHLQILTENVLVTMKLRTSTAQSTNYLQL